MSVMRTASGRDVDLRAPDPASITIRDIAAHLAKINRFCGATETPYCVAQHSVLVAKILALRQSNERVSLAGLLHDAHEAYLGDITRPVKDVLAVDVSGHFALDEAISRKFSLGGGLAHRDVHIADNIALAMEWRDLMPGQPPHQIAAFTALIPRLPRVCPVSWHLAEELFLKTFRNLAALCGVSTED